MDTGLLNLGEEHFATYYVQEEENHGLSSSDNRSYFNEWEDERELNGDIGLIPESSVFCETLKDATDFSDPSNFIQRMLDWSTFFYVEGVATIAHEAPISETEIQPESQSETKENVNTFNEKEISKFDLTKFITEPNSSVKTIKAPVKKIDVEAQKYIVDDNSSDDVIDVETVEGSSLPVLEASDAFSLLEQFEASEKPISIAHKNSGYDFTESLVNQLSTSSIEMFEKIPQTPINIFEEEDVKMDMENIKMEAEIIETFEMNVNKEIELEIIENVEMKKEIEPQITENVEMDIKKDVNLKLPVSNGTPESGGSVKNKHIRDALPQELIARINESGKRKTITVIPPIPNKKRGNSRSIDTASQHKNKVPKVIANEKIHFDHDYCASISPYPKDPHKDSGFQSADEDDRSVIRNQPTVKNADGKLMVSLLKVNTIRNNNKKKLNLEEYKRRRLINSNTTSQSNSPASSTCSSPLPEDETAKRMKHQEKLMKMAADLLKTTAKSAQPCEPIQVKQPPVQPIPRKVVEVVPPPDFEVKTYVSIGTNTDISSINCSKNILASAKELEEIKPLLQKVSSKINSNSFITSLIENIPKMKTKSAPRVISESSSVHEDKVIHYLKKDREPVKTNNVEVQTDFDFLGEDAQSRYRRRIDAGDRSPSCSTGSNPSNYPRRRDSSSSSNKSCSSCTSDSSSSSSSSRSSRSRSRSPRNKRQHTERLREVEERRVIYVGRITKGTTKEDLRRRFHHFGNITNISLHFRDYGDNYGFVTFANKQDAYEAVEHGNDGHSYPKYDLSFGGRRIFCQTSYSDLDNMREDEYNYHTSRAPADNSFDALLKAAQDKLRNRKP